MSAAREPGPSSNAALFEALFETAPDAMIVVDRDGCIVLANPQAERLFGYAAGELRGHPVEVLLPDSVRGAHVGYRSSYMDNPRVRPMGAGYELTGVRRSGEAFPVEIGLSPIRTGEGVLFAASIRDISETHRVRQALKRARHDTFAAQIGRLALESPSYEIAVESVPALIASALEVSAVAVLFSGSRRDDLHVRGETGLPERLRDALPRVVPLATLFGKLADGAPVGLTLTQFDAATAAPLVAELAHAGFQDAAAVPLLDRYEPMGALFALSKNRERFDRDALHFLQSVANIIAAAVQRSRSEEQLAHSQRLDAVGQLTGGIAHDFNNLLTVVSGNLQLLEAEIADQSGLREIIDSALRAVDRGAVLTRKLLAFARRQRLIPRAVLPTQLLADLKEMLQRTLGERIAVTVECPPDIPPVFADPGELDAALINLALNARDAMPRGGAVTIQARKDVLTESDGELPPGAYVVFTVTDTGIGMTPDVLARALEPFFTTKEAGKGNGMGLSMVYGFVKQSGGRMTIDSTLGYGTRIELFLPASSPRVAANGAPIPAPLHKGRETILVVEDEPEVRGIALAFLRSLGYTICEAADGESALEMLAARTDIELLFSDIVLGSGMTGFDLAREAKKLRPGLRILLTSGYERASGGPDASSDIEVLRKPYRREQLAAVVRKAFGDE